MEGWRDGGVEGEWAGRKLQKGGEFPMFLFRAFPLSSAR